MMAIEILNGLERSTATGEAADSIARQGFLEWAFKLSGPAATAEARAALATPEARAPESAAACAFVRFLRQASRPVSRDGRRGRRQSVH